MSESNSTEVWRPVVGYEGLYEVSNLGRVKGLDRLVFFATKRSKSPMPRMVRGKILQQKPTKQGYLQCVLYRGSDRWMPLVHRLVLAAFIGPCPGGMEACHRDGDNKNNVVDNLRWGTHVSNCDDRKRHGRTVFGSKHYTSVLDDNAVTNIISLSETVPTRCLARKFGVSCTVIDNIKRNKSWKHIERPKWFFPGIGRCCKLMRYQVIKIWEMRGLATTSELAKEFNVTTEAIRLIWTQERWKSVTSVIHTSPHGSSSTDHS